MRIKPRLQQEKWSLYWKTSMATRTFALDEFDLDVDELKMTARELKAMVMERVGLPSVDTLHRLEEFVEPWELIMYNGRELEDKKTLAASGVPSEDGAYIIVVRKQLIAEGWKLNFDDDEDSDTEEDDF